MNIYRKLNAARQQFHTLKLEKTGFNSFAKYAYFELGDFLIPALGCFQDHGLCAVIAFDKDMAVMTVTDIDKPEDKLTFSSPMSTAALKGCHEVQNLGAVQTYLRRYLWVAALEIVEHDAMDVIKPKETKEKIEAVKHSPVPEVEITPDRMQVIMAVVRAMREAFYERQDVIGAYEEYSGIVDGEEKIKLWDVLKPDSDLRSAIRKHGQSLKGEK